METTTLSLFYRFGTALVIGLLIGLQREYASYQEGTERGDVEDDLFAGARTFALMSLLGCAGAFAADLLGALWVFAALLLVVGALITTAYFLESREGDLGLTTEVAALLTLVAGALCYWDYLEVAAALAVTITVLLALKLQTRSLVRNITREDVYATLKFAVISLVVLPVLPRTGYGPPPFDVVVPHDVWLMVVFISGISFLGYLLIQIVGPRRGVGLTGLLGGLASSTAVTLSFAQRSHDATALAKSFALAILLAWGVMFGRVLIEVAVLNLPLLGIVWIPIVAALLVSLAYCGYLYATQDEHSDHADDDFTNPFELGPALTFGALYAVILLVANAAQLYLGDTGVYLSSIASGMADVDAITLSMAQLSQPDTTASEVIDLRTAARAIVLAAASNTVVKGGIVLTLGSKALRKAILPGLILTVATAIGVVFLL